MVNTLDVTASAAGFVSVWIDLNVDGDFADAGERVTNAQAVTPGLNAISIPLGANPPSNRTYVRVRYATVAAQVANPTGAAADGEVEDYQVLVERLTAPQVCSADTTEHYAFTFGPPSTTTGTGAVGSTVRYSNVAVIDGVAVDMFVEVVAGAMAPAAGRPNGLGVTGDDAAWSVNLDATLRYSFYEAGTTTPVAVNGVFTVNDMDLGSVPEIATFAAADLASYGVTQGSSVAIQQTGGNVSFTGTVLSNSEVTSRFQIVLEGRRHVRRPLAGHQRVVLLLRRRRRPHDRPAGM